MAEKKIIIIAHYSLNRKITKEECFDALGIDDGTSYEYIDFEIGNENLESLVNIPFNNIALTQHRKFAEEVIPILDLSPDAEIAYFGLTAIPIGFHFGFLIGNTRKYTVYQLNHTTKQWYANNEPPIKDYNFEIIPPELPIDIQKGVGDIVIRIGTSFNINKHDTYEVISNPENEFDIELSNPNIDSLFSQNEINKVVDCFQSILNCYANKLSGREKLHLFIASSSGLPFALGTRINLNIYPFIQTYQFSRNHTPSYVQAIEIKRETDNRIVVTEEEIGLANEIRNNWETQLQSKIKPYINNLAARKNSNWIELAFSSPDEFKLIKQQINSNWSSLISINRTTLGNDFINLKLQDVSGGFDYSSKTNSWCLDDGFLISVHNRLTKRENTCISQAGRLFLFHESLHFSKHGHQLTSDIANGIGQFPKVIEEADYQADVWALINEFGYCNLYDLEKLKKGVKEFFCNAIETAVETMWSFMDNGSKISAIQIRSMNRFLNWYWQWNLISKIEGKGTLMEVLGILLQKPIIEFAGLPVDLRGYRIFYKLDSKDFSKVQMATFYNNKVYRFTPNLIENVIEGFKELDGEKIKTGLMSYQVTL
jgi:hypothetical protein